MKAPFTHPGGKSRIAPRILELLPKHVCYVEPFCGAANVLFQKTRSQVEVVNDTNGDIVNTFRCLQRHLDAVLQELHLVVNSRAHFVAWRDMDAAQMTDVDRAARFLFLKALSFGGDGDSFGVKKSPGGGGASTNIGAIKSRLMDVHQRLQGVIIEGVDWDRCVRLYDGPDTLFYLDPPYLGGNTSSYTAWKPEKLARCMEVLRGIKGRFVLSMNGSPETRRLMAGFNIINFNRARGIKTKARYPEMLVRNF